MTKKKPRRKPADLAHLDDAARPPGGPSLQAQDSISVGGDVVGRDKVIQVTNIHTAAPVYQPGSAPPPPALLTGRENDLAALKQCLSPESRSVGQRLWVVRGGPGLGKTALLRALAHDQDLRAAYPDGVVWVALSSRPQLLLEMASCGRALGADELQRAKSLEEASARLAEILRARRMLILIDDVWKTEHGTPFLVGGPNCATLLTTRVTQVAENLAPTPAHMYVLPPLSEPAALALLTHLAPQVMAQHPQPLQALGRKLEGSPLGLQVAGRLVNAEASRGFDVLDLLTEIAQGAALMEAAAPPDRADFATETTPSVAAVLQKSVEHLDAASRRGFARLGAMAPEPATFDIEALRYIWEVADPKPIIRVLRDRGILEYLEPRRRYWMHALFVMLANWWLKRPA